MKYHQGQNIEQILAETQLLGSLAKDLESTDMLVAKAYATGAAQGIAWVLNSADKGAPSPAQFLKEHLGAGNFDSTIAEWPLT